MLLAHCDVAIFGGRFGDLASVGGRHWDVDPVVAGAATGRCGGSTAGVAGNGRVVG